MWRGSACLFLPPTSSSEEVFNGDSHSYLRLATSLPTLRAGRAGVWLK